MSERTATFRESRREAPAGGGPPGLVVLFSEAPFAGDGIYPVRPEMIIGRSPECFVFIQDSAMSRLHAAISQRDGKLTLKDQASHNGTHVNGRRVEGTAPLFPGTVVRCGSSLLLVVDDIEPFASWRAWGALGPLVGGPAMQRLRSDLAALAGAGLELLVTGESGTGKELVAAQIHHLSERPGKLIPVNCAALPETLFEAELFGSAQGAFTGAVADRKGLLSAAHQGTLFLDEVAELPLALQPKLLRALESKEVWPVGARAPLKVDFGLVAATNRDLDLEVREGRFREDLYYRLKGAQVTIPPLRIRIEDVPLLCDHFLKPPSGPGEASMGTLAMERLLLHPWRGNVRELQRVVREAAASASANGSPRILPDHLRDDLLRDDLSDPPDQRLADILEMLKQQDGNVSRAAAALGLHRAQVYRLLQRGGIDPADFRNKE